MAQSRVAGVAPVGAWSAQCIGSPVQVDDATGFIGLFRPEPGAAVNRS